MTEDKRQAAINRGARAQALLNDELLQEAFVKLEADYIKAWRESAPRDDGAREKLWLAVNIVGKVREHLVIAMTGGNLAQREINDLVAREQRRKVFGVV